MRESTQCYLQTRNKCFQNKDHETRQMANKYCYRQQQAEWWRTGIDFAKDIWATMS